MTFTELVAAVYTETNRPDLVAETQQAVLSSLLKIHCMEFMYKDIQTAEVVFDSAAYIQTLDTPDLPRFRSIAYFRKNDPSYAAYQQNPTLFPPLGTYPSTYPNPVMGFLRIISPDAILDEFDTEKFDVCYQAGSTLFIKSSTPLQYALMGWYAYPNLDITAGGRNFNSWIAREYPYAPVYDAASAILQKIGMTDAARKYDAPADSRGGGGLATTNIATLIMNNITAQGS